MRRRSDRARTIRGRQAPRAARPMLSRMQFSRVFPNVYGCVVTIGDDAFSSGVVFVSPPEDGELTAALDVAARRLDELQRLGLHRLKVDVAAALGARELREDLSRSDLVSISALWDETAGEPVVSLSYGADDGVCIVAKMRRGVVAEAGAAEG